MSLDQYFQALFLFYAQVSGVEHWYKPKKKNQVLHKLWSNIVAITAMTFRHSFQYPLSSKHNSDFNLVVDLYYTGWEWHCKVITRVKTRQQRMSHHCLQTTVCPDFVACSTNLCRLSPVTTDSASPFHLVSIANTDSLWYMTSEVVVWHSHCEYCVHIHNSDSLLS